MSLDSASDPLVVAIAALVRDHVNGATAAELGENAIVAVYQHPDVLPLAPQAELPCLSVCRGPERGIGVSSTHLDQRVSIQLDYVSPGTPFDRLGARWPLLNLVWREALRAIRLGYSPHHAGGARVLDALGVMFLFPTSINKVERFADTEGRAYPAFRATLDLEVREDGSVPAQDFTSLSASIDLLDQRVGTHAAAVGVIELPDPTDLAECIALGNEMRAEWNLHLASTEAHVAADAANVLTSPPATDEATLFALLDELVVDLTGHFGDAAPEPAWHRYAVPEIVPALSAAGFTELPPPPATDLVSAIYVARLLRFALRIHFAQAPSPVVGHVRVLVD